MPRGYFAISAVSTYSADGPFRNGEFVDLDHVPREARTMRTTLAGLGLVELFGAGTDLTHRDLVKELWGWASQHDPEAEQKEESTLVLYCTGHGGLPFAGSGWRMVPPTPNKESPNEWVRPEELLEPLLAQGKGVTQVVLILDACFAGDGAREALTRSFNVSLETGATTGVWVLASARRTDEAQQMVFAPAFTTALHDAAGKDLRAEYLDPSTTIDAAADLMSGLQQRPWVAVGREAGDCRALPNPRYMPVTVPDWIERRWSAPARGVTDPDEGGWYFTGRDELLQRLVRHLTGGPAEPPVLLLTGAAGTGRTAVLARLLTTATQRQRDAMPVVARQGYLPETDLAVVGLDAAGLTVEQAAADLARRLDLPAGTATDLVGRVAALGHRPAVLVDNLDRAADPAALTGQLLLPLAGTVRLVVVPDADPAAFEGVERVAVAADDEASVVARYVLLRLEYGLTAAGATARREVTRVATELAGTCLGSFSAAATAVDTLLREVRRAGRPLRAAHEAADLAANRVLEALCRSAMTPVAAGAAGRHADHLVECLAAACAYSVEGWLPESVWAGVARRAYATPCSGEQVGDLAARASAFLAQRRGDQGERAWRPRFAARAVDLTATGDRLVRDLVDEARDRYGAGWDGVHPGMAAILLGAAAQAHGRYADLLDDANLLLAAPPAEVTRSLRAVRGRPDGQRRVATWAGVPVRADRPDRAFLLGLLARRHGLDRLAATAGAAGGPGTPRCRWAVRVAAAGHRAPVTRMALAGPAGAYLVTAHDDGTVAWWDGSSGAPVPQWPPVPGGGAPVTGVSAALSVAGLVTVAVRADRDVRCWGPVADEPPRALGPATVAVTHPSGLVVCVDGQAVRVVDVVAGSAVRHCALPAEIVAADLAGVVEEPVLWLVDIGGRIWRWNLSAAGGRQPSPVGPGSAPLLLAAARDGGACVVVGTDGGLNLPAGGRTVPRRQRTGAVRCVAVDERWVVVGGGSDARSGWIELHDARRPGPGDRWPLDAAPVGSGLAGGTLVVATPDGLAAVALTAADEAGGDPAGKGERT
ncbi:hypothetical protein [Micromonospora fluostatini]|uniref:hypothetical protein n=1 Tax=Micromonospora sp. JCM 30529 TaxID=3421643 RepID=UPI003D1721F2